MSKATTHLDDVEAPDYSGDGESTVDAFESTPQLVNADGENTFGAPDVAGGDRVTESVEEGVLDASAVLTSEPVRPKDSEKSEAPKAEPKKAPAKAAAPKAAAPKADADAKADADTK
jgi:hypothetical protein